MVLLRHEIEGVIDVYLGTSTYLFAIPSFKRGLARAIDIGSTMDVYNESENGNAADARAIASDWKQVGLDILEAVEEYGKKAK